MNYKTPPSHRIIKLSCGDIVAGLVTTDDLGKRTIQKPWEYINLGTLNNPQYTFAPYQLFLWGDGKEITNLELKDSQIVYEFSLDREPKLKEIYLSKSAEASGIQI